MPSASASAEFGRHAERAQNVDHEPMANAHALRHRFPLLGEEYAAIGPRGREPGALETRNRLDRGGVRNAETPGDVGRPRFAGILQQVGDQFHIVFQQGGRLRRTGLAEAPRLGAFRRKLLRGRSTPALCRLCHRRCHRLRRGGLPNCAIARSARSRFARSRFVSARFAPSRSRPERSRPAQSIAMATFCNH